MTVGRKKVDLFWGVFDRQVLTEFSQKQIDQFWGIFDRLCYDQQSFDVYKSCICVSLHWFGQKNINQFLGIFDRLFYDQL